MSRRKFFLLQLLLLSANFLVVLLISQGLHAITSDPNAPILVEMTLFVTGLWILNRLTAWWPLSIVFWLSLLFLGKSFSETILGAGVLPAWIIAPLLLFILGGMYRILSIEIKRMCLLLHVNTILGRNFFLLSILLLFFGYFGAAGFTTSNPPSILLSWLSWMMVPLGLNLFYKKLLH